MLRCITFFLATTMATVLISAQIRVGTVRGTVLDETEGVLPGGLVRLENAISGYKQVRNTDGGGNYEFNNVPFGSYILQIEFPGFEVHKRELPIHSNIPIEERIVLRVETFSELVTVEVRKQVIEEDSSASKTILDANALQRAALADSGEGLARLILTTPGWVPDDNGRIHARGTASQILYVVDGIPIIDRLDTAFAPSLDPRAVQALEIVTGNIAAEYGNRLGAVVNIQNKSGVDQPFGGTVTINAGNFRRAEAALTFGGAVNHQLAISFSTLVSRSDRFLDPPSEENFNNRGGSIKLNGKLEWHPTEQDIVRVVLTGSGTDFQVPNRPEQQLAGQRSRQESRSSSQSLMWQHVWNPVTVTNVAGYRRSFRFRLKPSPFDTPISASQDRKHSQEGFLGSLSRQLGRHHIKVGLELFRTPIQESFSFFITRPEEVEVTPVAAQFVRGNPFDFQKKLAGEQYSGFVQGTFKLTSNLTVEAGLRYDNYHMLIADDEFSPRIGAAYFFPRTHTVLRASYNRLFQPPQNENLLLASSPEASALSPLTQGRRFAPILPDKQNVFEVGIGQSIFDVLALDIAYYWKKIENFSDRNQFLDTGIIFPISIAEGDIEGLDVSLILLPYQGFSAYASWSNSRAFGIGPINGGLFLSEEVAEIGPGFVFPNDHDQRNTVAFGVTYSRERWNNGWISFQGRHDSGLPLEIEEEALLRLKQTPGADLVNFERARVKPHTTFDLSGGIDFAEKEAWQIQGQMVIKNLFDTRFVHNFESVFGGTHFGNPRLYTFQLQFLF